MGNALADRFDIRLMTGAQILREQTIPDVDYILTGSMGGLLAMEFLPPTVKRLVLISSTARFCAGDNYPCGTPEKILRRMILQLRRNPEAVLDEFFKNVHYPFRESRAAIALRQSIEYNLDELMGGLEYLLESDLREIVPGIQIPVLLMHGSDDRIIPAEASKWLHENLPNGQLKMIENDGHALPAHHFESVMHSIRAFLPTDEAPAYS